MLSRGLGLKTKFFGLDLGLGLGLAFFGLGIGLELCGLVNITANCTFCNQQFDATNF